MGNPMTIDIPHKLGRAKIESSGQLAGIVPGGALKAHRWEGDTLVFTIEALGQRVATIIEVLDDRIRAIVDLAPMLALLAGQIRAKLLGIGIPSGRD
jgi:hypothetical protein